MALLSLILTVAHRAASFGVQDVNMPEICEHGVFPGPKTITTVPDVMETLSFSRLGTWEPWEVKVQEVLQTVRDKAVVALWQRCWPQQQVLSATSLDLQSPV